MPKGTSRPGTLETLTKMLVVKEVVDRGALTTLLATSGLGS